DRHPVDDLTVPAAAGYCSLLAPLPEGVARLRGAAGRKNRRTGAARPARRRPDCLSYHGARTHRRATLRRALRRVRVRGAPALRPRDDPQGGSAPGRPLADARGALLPRAGARAIAG